MEPYTLAQKLKLCAFCKTEIVQVYCDTCHVKLCNACIGEHMASKESKEKHEIIRFNFQKSNLFYPSCTSHDRILCEMYCKQCEKPVCNKCVTSYQHSGHRFLKYFKALKERKKKIMKEKKELDAILLTYQNIASDEANMEKNLENGYGVLSRAITKHGEEWHREVDKIVEKLKAEVDEIKTEHFKILKSQLNEIKEKISKIRDDINTINHINIDSQDISELLSITFNIDEYRQHSQNIALTFPTFIYWPIHGEKLSSIFGTISPSKRHSYSCVSVKQLLDKPEITNHMFTKYEFSLYNVACVSDDEIWMCGNENTVKLYSVIWGTILTFIPTKSGNIPTDIAVTGQGNLVYIDPDDRTVNILRNEKVIETLIKLKDWKPQNICNTSSGDLLVVMNRDDFKQSRVVRYSGSTEKQTIQFDDKGDPLYSSYSPDTTTKYISENKNQDICVADFGANAVVVVNWAGKLRFRYTGHTPAAALHKNFQPRGITTDSQGHILTIDHNNQCVHILDQDGQFLRYIDCELNHPWVLCVDSNDYLFVAQSDYKQVKKIKYMQEN